MTKNIYSMTLEEIELDLGNEESGKIRKALLKTLYEKKLRENTEVK